MEQKISTRHRILIIEDDRPLASGLCRALQNEAVEAVGCHTLREAAGLLGMTEDAAHAERMPDRETVGSLGRKAAFDLVVLDVNLPDGNGFDFLQKIKAKHDICVILLTANDMETDIVAGLELGADDYITKPFSLAVLRARVETQLRRVTQRKTAEASAGNVGGAAADRAADGTKEGAAAGGRSELADDGWIIDGAYRFHFAKMLFFHGEEQIELSKTEQRILRMLLENRNATLTREQLLTFVWSVDAAFVDENTLSVAVKRLRDKLGAQEKIKTVYGIGYKWENA